MMIRIPIVKASALEFGHSVALDEMIQFETLIKECRCSEISLELLDDQDHLRTCQYWRFVNLPSELQHIQAGQELGWNCDCFICQEAFEQRMMTPDAAERFRQRYIGEFLPPSGPNENRVYGRAREEAERRYIEYRREYQDRAYSRDPGPRDVKEMLKPVIARSPKLGVKWCEIR